LVVSINRDMERMREERGTREERNAGGEKRGEQEEDSPTTADTALSHLSHSLNCPPQQEERERKGEKTCQSMEDPTPPSPTAASRSAIFYTSS
jgi:hypothetical protein